MRTRVSPALVVACFALAVALGGAGYAAVKLPKNSVGPAQLKKNAVSGPKVKNKSLGKADINQSTLAFGKAISLPGLAFHPRGSGTTSTGVAATGCTYKVAGGDPLVAPVSLPQGAKVKKVVFQVLDTNNGVSTDINVYFNRYDAVNFNEVILRTGSTNGAVPAIREVVLTGSPITVVNNARYTYGLEVAMTSGVTHVFCEARVEYALP